MRLRNRQRRQSLCIGKDDKDFGGSAELDDLTMLWALRILVPLRGYHNFVKSCWQAQDVLAVLLGSDEPIDFEASEDRREIQRQLTAMYRRMEQNRPSKSNSNRALAVNIRQIGELLGLSAVELSVLEFLIILTGTPVLMDIANSLGDLSTLKFQHALAMILDLPEAKVRSALAPHAILEESGLLSLQRGDNNGFSRKFELLSSGFVDYMMTEEQDPVNSLRDRIIPVGPPTLGLSDFTHLGNSLDVLREHLRLALADGDKGCNIFCHGSPGTGKTELAKVLAQAIGHEIFEIVSHDDDGDPISAKQRLRALRTAQNIFSKRPVLLLFDEAEDVFNDGGFFGISTAQSHKASLNRMLENNQVPTIWISNSTNLDPAFVRRFDLVQRGAGAASPSPGSTAAGDLRRHFTDSNL